MNQFGSEFINFNTLFNSDEVMNTTEDAESYYFRVTEERNENNNPIPLVNEETSDPNNILSLNYPDVDNMYSSIVDDINNIYKDYPLQIESFIGMNMGLEDPNDIPSTSNIVDGEQNYNTDALMNVDSEEMTDALMNVDSEEMTDALMNVDTEEMIDALMNVDSEEIIDVLMNVDSEDMRSYNIIDIDENIIIVSDDEDENTVQLNGEQNETICISDTEDDCGSETRQPVQIVQLTSRHELRSAKNIKKILPRFKTKVQENLQFLSTKSVTFVVKSIDGYKLKASDLVTLITPKAWLNDVIILNYLTLLVQHSNQLLLDPDMLRSCIQKGFVPEWHQDKLNNTHEYNKIIIPINPNGNHWALVVLEIQEGKMNIIDSVNGTYTNDLNLINKFICLAFPMINPNNFDYFRLYSPLQSNTDDCGVFTCTNARYYLYNKQPDFAQRDIPLLRHRIAWELINNTVIPFN